MLAVDEVEGTAWCRRIGLAVHVLGESAVEVGRESDVEQAVLLALQDADAVWGFFMGKESRYTREVEPLRASLHGLCHAVE